METVLIVIHLFIVVALIAVILLQRSEGGALGIGGGSGGGLMSARGSANLLTRTTAILAALFFATSIGLTIMGQLNNESESILQRATEQNDGSTTVLDALNTLSNDSTDGQSGSDLDLPVPSGDGASTTEGQPSQ